jgi:hypothetical protein
MEEIPVTVRLEQAWERIKTYEATGAQQLDLSGLGLRANDLRALMPAIHRLPNLRSLDLSDITLSNNAVQELNLGSIWGTVKVNLAFAENDTYTGTLKWGQLSGEGVRNFPNGDRYEGIFRQGAFNGQGTLKRANGNFYKGEFKMGQYHGKGTFSRPDGNTYEGDFSEGTITGYGTLKYPSGDVQTGRFEKGFRVFEEVAHQKKMNSVPTLVVRSKRMEQEQRALKYELHKHKEGGAPIKAVVTSNARELMEALNAMLEQQKETTAFKLVFNQHSGAGVNPDIKIDTNGARAILQLLTDKGIEDIRISSHSCDLAEARVFMEAAPEFTQNAQITVRTVPDGKDAYEGWKQNPEGEKKFTSFFISDEGEYVLRDLHVYEKQQKQTLEIEPKSAKGQLQAFTAPLNQNKARSAAVGKAPESVSKLQGRKKTIYSKR